MSKRFLIVTADDYGIGPATSDGILQLARDRKVTAAVLLVNSPYAEAAVGAWRQSGRPMELGWHPCLTIDRPVAPPRKVASLLAPDGRFWTLAGFMVRLLLGRIRPVEIETEFQAQLRRFIDLTGQIPSLVNTHHHVQVFPPVGNILCRVLDGLRPRPYLRRVREPIGMLARIPGARLKRACLTALGRRNARAQERAGFPGSDWLAGITDPPCVADPQFLHRWLTSIRGELVELTCHPGKHDLTLLGRDCLPGDGHLERRVREFELLAHPSFEVACRHAGFTLTAPSELRRPQVTTTLQAA